MPYAQRFGCRLVALHYCAWRAI